MVVSDRGIPGTSSSFYGAEFFLAEGDYSEKRGRLNAVSKDPSSGVESEIVGFLDETGLEFTRKSSSGDSNYNFEPDPTVKQSEPASEDNNVSERLFIESIVFIDVSIRTSILTSGGNVFLIFSSLALILLATVTVLASDCFWIMIRTVFPPLARSYE